MIRCYIIVGVMQYSIFCVMLYNTSAISSHIGQPHPLHGLHGQALKALLRARDYY